MQGEGEKCGETERCDEAKEMPDGDDELSLEVCSSKWGGVPAPPTMRWACNVHTALYWCFTAATGTLSGTQYYTHTHTHREHTGCNSDRE